MDVSGGTATAGVELQPVLEDARRYSFFQLVDLIHRYHDDDLEAPEGPRPEDERIRFSSSAGLGFPGTDVVGAARPRGGHAPYEMEVSFLGLHGSQSPLPGFYLEDLAWEYCQNQGVRRYFLDFFNHRMVTLFHRIWRKYRYYIRYRPGAVDGFSNHVLALAGLSDKTVRESIGLSESKLLAYAGMLAGRSRSPEVVCSVIGHCFELEDVSIEPFVLRRVAVPADQQTALGQRNARLGQDTVLGDAQLDRSGKFILRIGGLSAERFPDFLPDGKEFKRLVRLMDVILREPLAYDLELSLTPEATRPLSMGEDCRLGWNTFCNPEPGAQQPPIRIQIRA